MTKIAIIGDGGNVYNWNDTYRHAAISTSEGSGLQETNIYFDRALEGKGTQES